MARRYISLGHFDRGSGGNDGIKQQKKVIPSTASFLFLTCLSSSSSDGAESFLKINY